MITTTCTSFNHIQILLSTSWHCVHQKWHLHLSQHCHCQPNANEFISSILRNPRICCLQWTQATQKKLLQPTSHWSIPPCSNWDIWMFTQTSWCVTRFYQCHLELERAKGQSSFCLSYISLSKDFNHITKDANIFHLKLGGGRRPNYFPTSILLKHTFHHHGWPIACDRFLTSQNMIDLL